MRPAPWAAKAAAPLLPAEPATISTCPKLPLCPARGRSGKLAAAPKRVRDSALQTVPGAWSAMPIRATRTSPARLRPGSRSRPGLGSPMVSVASAETATPISCPVSADSPEGRSTASTRSAWKEPLRAALMRSMLSAAVPVTARVSPVPKIASTSTPRCGASQSGPSSRTPSARARSKFRAASSERDAASASTAARTRAPSPCRCRAATRPSPPLLPAPQTTQTSASAASSSSTQAASSRPALSINTSPGTPSVSML